MSTEKAKAKQIQVEANVATPAGSLQELIETRKILPRATTAVDGAMSKEDKAKLEGLPSNAELDTTLEGKVNKVTGKGLSTNDYSNADKAKLEGLPSSLDLAATLEGKVDKQSGKGLSANDYSDADKAKLSSLESSHFRGVYVNEAALATIPDPIAGDYADVDAGVGSDAERWIYDASDSKWIVQESATSVTASQVKQLYESNTDTNAFTDSEKSKLSGIAAGATKNDTDANLKSRANHTGTQAISTVSGLQSALDGKEAAFTKNTAFNKNFGTGEGTVTQGNDTRLSNSREWTGATVSQTEAEAGTSTTRRAWTAQRVRQAIAAWWNTIGTAFGKTLLGSTDAAAARGSLGLGTASTKNVGSSYGEVATIGVNGWGVTTQHNLIANNVDFRDLPSGSYSVNSTHPQNIFNDGSTLLVQARTNFNTAFILQKASGFEIAISTKWSHPSGDIQWSILTGSQNLLSKTGQSTTYPMTQKSVTDGLKGKVDKVTGKGLSTNDFTTPLLDKLTSLEGSHFRGVYLSEAALSTITDPVAGDYADVDTGAGSDAERWIYDASDAKWVAQESTTSLTAAQVKQLYESNNSTNAFTDDDKSKLTALKTTVPQAEAELGTSTVVRAWTSQRVRQAITAWWNTASTGFGKTLLSSDTPSDARTSLQLGTAATMHVVQGTGTSTGGLMSQNAVTEELYKRVAKSTKVTAGTGLNGGGDLSVNLTLSVKYGTTEGTALQGNAIVQTVGTDTAKVMSQKAVTDTINAVGVGTGNFSTVLGRDAGAVGNSSTALGAFSNASGANSIALGVNAKALSINSTALGNGATASGDYSTSLGIVSTASGDYSTALGFNAGAEGTFSTALGGGAATDGDRQIQIGQQGGANAPDVVYSAKAITVRSDQNDKSDIRDIDLGLNFIMQLRPVKFKYDYQSEYLPERPDDFYEWSKEDQDAWHEERSNILNNGLVEKDGTHKGSREQEGFLYQQVKAVADSMDTDFSGLVDATVNGGSKYANRSLAHEKFIAPMVKAMQEQQAIIESLTARIEQLEQTE